MLKRHNNIPIDTTWFMFISIGKYYWVSETAWVKGHHFPTLLAWEKYELYNLSFN